MMKVEKIFDSSAKKYDKMEDERFQVITNKIIEYTKKYLKADDIVLDFGCATGSKALSLAGGVKKIHAIDISSNMIDLAKSKALDRKIENVDFEQATLDNLNWPNESFDVVMAFNVLHLLENDREAVLKIHELLKPQGLLITNIPCLAEKMHLFTKLKFQFYVFLSKIRLFPNIKRYKYPDVDHLINSGQFYILKKEYFYLDLSSLYLVAQKI